MHGDANEGEKARVRTGRPPVITMIRTTKRSAKKRAGEDEEEKEFVRLPAPVQNGGLNGEARVNTLVV